MTTNCWSTFTGGYVAYPDLEINIAQEPGDNTLGRAGVLTHFVEDITSGERLCHVRFTKKEILRPTGKVYKALDLRCPIEGCLRICSSEESLKKHLRGPTDKAFRGGYHKWCSRSALEKHAYTKELLSEDEILILVDNKIVVPTSLPEQFEWCKDSKRWVDPC